MTSIIKLPQLAWQGGRELELNIPDNWQVEVCNIAGYKTPAMKPEQIKAEINRPLDTPPIREMAKNKQQVVIICDDMSRVTRAATIVPFILEELAEAGIPDSRIRFVSALGCHGAMNRIDFARKLGEAVVSRFPVYNHKAFDSGCIPVGTTSQGIKVSANAEVMKCDFKIAIGSIEPHVLMGFGGGSKIILPGITSFETNKAFHALTAKLEREHPKQFRGMGMHRGNPMRQDLDDAAAMVGLNIKIDTIFNMWGEITHVFTGTTRATFANGVDVADKHYLSPRAVEKDIVIANTYAKVSEPHSAITNSLPSISRNGGDLVLICNAPEGQVVHFLFGSFGREAAGTALKRPMLPPNLNRLIIYSEYPNATFSNSFAPAEKVITVDKWEKVLELLDNPDYRKRNARVAVYPSAEIQYFTPTLV